MGGHEAPHAAHAAELKRRGSNGHRPTMTLDPPSFVDVVFPASLETALTYHVPEAWRFLATPGKRVLAPLGRRTATGYLVGARGCAPVAEVKDLCEILDAEPLLDTHLLELTRWVADYYLCSWGEMIRTALPPGIDSFTRRVVRLTTAGQSARGGNAVLRPGERELLDFLSSRDPPRSPRLQGAGRTPRLWSAAWCGGRSSPKVRKCARRGCARCRWCTAPWPPACAPIRPPCRRAPPSSAPSWRRWPASRRASREPRPLRGTLLPSPP